MSTISLWGLFSYENYFPVRTISLWGLFPYEYYFPLGLIPYQDYYPIRTISLSFGKNKLGKDFLSHIDTTRILQAPFGKYSVCMCHLLCLWKDGDGRKWAIEAYMHVSNCYTIWNNPESHVLTFNKTHLFFEELSVKQRLNSKYDDSCTSSCSQAFNWHKNTTLAYLHWHLLTSTSTLNANHVYQVPLWSFKNRLTRVPLAQPSPHIQVWLTYRQTD